MMKAQRVWGSWAARCCAVLAVMGLGCNAILGLESPVLEQEASAANGGSGGAGGATSGSAGGEDRCAGIVCDVPNACQLAGSCDPATGECVYPARPDGTSCDDSSACTEGDVCQAGQCQGSPLKSWTSWDPNASHDDQRYQIDGQVVVDVVTGRVWQRDVEAVAPMTWQSAQSYCAALTLGPYTSGWRLPTRVELLSLVDYSRHHPAINDNAFPNTPHTTNNDYFWTASENAENLITAWTVIFSNGVATALEKAYINRARCVR